MDFRILLSYFWAPPAPTILKKKASPREVVSIYVNFFAIFFSEFSKNVGLLQGGVVVGLLQGGVVVGLLQGGV